MCRREHCHQLSFEDFFLPFGSKHSGDNRWIRFAELIPWDELEGEFAVQLCKGFGAMAKPFRIVLGELNVMARLWFTDVELVEQIRENPCLQFFICLQAFQYSVPFDPSMMVYFRKRLPEAVVNHCNERIVRHGLNVIRASDSQDPGDGSDNGGGSASTAEQPISYALMQPNQGSLLIVATCAPIDIRHLTDLSLLNEAREVTRLIRQWGVVCIVALLAVVAVVAVGFCEAVPQLATRFRRREEDRRI